MRSSLDGFYETLTVEHFSGIEAIALDMWDPYIASVRGRARESDGKIVFDKLHVVQHLGALEKVLRQENPGGCWGLPPGKETLRLAAEPHLDWSRKTVRNSPN